MKYGSEPAVPGLLERPGLAGSHTGEVERKLAAVLFVDLVGSTALVAGSDPEVARRRVTEFFELVSRIIDARRHRRAVCRDAVMGAFGVPRAHEDDTERALRAAIEIREAVTELGLESRIGVEAGEIVSDETDTTFATGQAVNVAARGRFADGVYVATGTAAAAVSIIVTTSSGCETIAT